MLNCQLKWTEDVDIDEIVAGPVPVTDLAKAIVSGEGVIQFFWDSETSWNYYDLFEGCGPYEPPDLIVLPDGSSQSFECEVVDRRISIDELSADEGTFMLRTDVNDEERSPSVSLTLKEGDEFDAKRMRVERDIGILVGLYYDGELIEHDEAMRDALIGQRYSMSLWWRSGSEWVEVTEDDITEILSNARVVPKQGNEEEIAKALRNWSGGE